MPTISFTVSAGNATLIREALAHHNGEDVADITVDDVKAYAGSHIRHLVQQYRKAQRNAANPVDTTDPLE